MTIDERLERLTERHEALTQSVELLTRDVADMSATMERGNAETRATLNEVTELIRTLAEVASIHERRLDDHERRLPH